MTIGKRLCSLIENGDSRLDLSHHDNSESWTPTSALDGMSDLNVVASLVMDALGDAHIESCRVVRLRKKMRKMFFEVEVCGNGGLRHCIGKIYGSDRGRTHFDALQRLRNAGFCPPSSFTVVHPVVYLDEHCLLLQEKAPGRPLADVLSDGNAAASKAVANAGLWLASLHSTFVDIHSRIEKIAANIVRYGSELAAVLPREAARLDELMSSALSALLTPGLSLVPSHGDFHSKNVYITEDGRVTVIDFDTFGRQECAADVAYFLAQTAIIDHHRHGSFEISQQHRDGFLRSYQNASPSVPGDRIALHLGITFLQSLHYELCVLHTRNLAIVELWLRNIERFLLDGETTIVDRPAGQSMRRPMRVAAVAVESM
jgi:phosphotransferase family enzyme